MKAKILTVNKREYEGKTYYNYLIRIGAVAYRASGKVERAVDSECEVDLLATKDFVPYLVVK